MLFSPHYTPVPGLQVHALTPECWGWEVDFLWQHTVWGKAPEVRIVTCPCVLKGGCFNLSDGQMSLQLITQKHHHTGAERNPKEGGRVVSTVCFSALLQPPNGASPTRPMITLRMPQEDKTELEHNTGSRAHGHIAASRGRTEKPLISGCTRAGEAQALWKEFLVKDCLLGLEETTEATVDRQNSAKAVECFYSWYGTKISAAEVPKEPMCCEIHLACYSKGSWYPKNCNCHKILPNFFNNIVILPQRPATEI